MVRVWQNNVYSLTYKIGTFNLSLLLVLLYILYLLSYYRNIHIHYNFFKVLFTLITILFKHLYIKYNTINNNRLLHKKIKKSSSTRTKLRTQLLYLYNHLAKLRSCTYIGETFRLRKLFYYQIYLILNKTFSDSL